MFLLELPSEILTRILNMCKNIDKCNFMLSCRTAYNLRFLLSYKETIVNNYKYIPYKKIMNLDYLNSFEFVKYNDIEFSIRNIDKIQIPLLITGIEIVTTQANSIANILNILSAFQISDKIKQLIIGPTIYFPIKEGFASLTNLTHLNLTFRYNLFTHTFGNSLYHMTNLKHLTIYFPTKYADHYWHPDQDIIFGGFDHLINLTHLTLSNYNYNLGHSLYNLIKLKYLNLGEIYDRPFNDSLYQLKNLDTLIINSCFNHDLGSDLNYLTNLKILYLGTVFNQALGYSLNNLESLRFLQLSKKFNQLLGDSLNKLTNLETLIIGDSFNQPLGNSLNNLINLKQLSLGGKFNEPFKNSLDNLTKLELLIIGSSDICSYKCDLDCNFDKLISLKEIKIGSYKHSINNNFNLEEFNANRYKFNYIFNILINSKWFDKK